MLFFFFGSRRLTFPKSLRRMEWSAPFPRIVNLISPRPPLEAEESDLGQVTSFFFFFFSGLSFLTAPNQGARESLPAQTWPGPTPTGRRQRERRSQTTKRALAGGQARQHALSGSPAGPGRGSGTLTGDSTAKGAWAGPGSRPRGPRA